MKNVLLTLSLVVLLGGVGFSQKTSSGTFMAGGNIGMAFNTQKSDDGTSVTTDGKHTLIEVTPSIGYFVMDGLVAGAGINVSSESFKNDGTADKQTLTTFGILPFARYYLGMGVFGHAGVALGSGKFTDVQDNGAGNPTTTTTSKLGLFGFEVGAGYAYFLNDNVAIEPMLLYSSNNIKYKDAVPVTKDIEGGLQLRIGISVFL